MKDRKDKARGYAVLDGETKFTKLRLLLIAINYPCLTTIYSRIPSKSKKTNSNFLLNQRRNVKNLQTRKDYDIKVYKMSAPKSKVMQSKRSHKCIIVPTATSLPKNRNDNSLLPCLRYSFSGPNATEHNM